MFHESDQLIIAVNMVVSTFGASGHTMFCPSYLYIKKKFRKKWAEWPSG